MEIKASNTVKFEDINQMNKTHLSGVKIMLWIFLASIAVILLVSIIFKSLGNNFTFCFAGFLWCAFVYVYMFVLSPHTAYRSFIKKYGSSPINYILDEKSICISTKNEDGTWNIKKDYCDMFKFTETESCFFIHIKRNEAYVLKKSGITQGSADDIRNAVSKEMGNRFVIKIKGKK